ncbi:hypothetical protein KIPB_011615 [Kipferlia bialata]|uniref:Uncharacterized protein n=1 Tax=Kipferlia bialata TaxID=797122 RepID=A0A9K3GNX0_9EUKA|nr:hypothetical protein KIPB_011615 [Kipferlia bialata]|eukprot:g11615.t1
MSKPCLITCGLSIPSLPLSMRTLSGAYPSGEVGSTFDSSMLCVQLGMMGLAIGTLVYLLVKGMRGRRAGRNVVTIDVFVGATLFFDLVYVMFWCLITSGVVSSETECQIFFVLDYIGGIGGDFVMACFAHFSHRIISCTCNKQTGTGVVPTPRYGVYTIVLFATLCGLCLIVMLRDMWVYNPDAQDQCWFIADAHHYALWWFEMPRVLLAVITLVYLSLGFRLIYRQRGASGEQTSAYIWRYVWYSFPSPLVRMIPTAANAAVDINVAEAESFRDTTTGHVLFYIASTNVLVTVIAYIGAHWAPGSIVGP